MSVARVVEPELHVIGEVVGCSLRGMSGGLTQALLAASSTLLGCGGRGENAFAGWEVKAGREWKCVGGREAGQTQVDYPENGHTCVWNHPLDLHYYTSSLAGWPQLVFEVGTLDFYGGKHLVGYGFCYVPNSSGVHDLEVDIWKPCGLPLEELLDFHLGGGPALVDTDVIASINKAKEDRCHLFTQSVGTVRLHLECTLRNFSKHHVSSGSGDPRVQQMRQ